MRSLVRRLLPPQAKRAVRHGIDAIDEFSPRLFSANGWLASLYYLIFSRRFDREHVAVLKGRAAYQRLRSTTANTSPVLRRNVHRLEKALIMKPRRKIFAQEFILETVQCYAYVCKNPNYSLAEIKWATDVLDKYFNVVEHNKNVARAFQEYARVRTGNQLDEQPRSPQFSPYLLSDRPESDISFDQLATLYLRRRSVRWYRQQTVPLAHIQKAINVAATAPSACNRQPYRFEVTNDPDRAAEIAKCAGGTAGFAHQIPAIAVVVGDLSAYPKERDRHLIYVDSSLASMQLMLAAETLGLCTCPINWPDVDSAERKLQGIFSLQEYERVVMLIAIGYGEPSSGVAYSQKKQDSLITRIREAE